MWFIRSFCIFTHTISEKNKYDFKNTRGEEMLQIKGISKQYKTG